MVNVCVARIAAWLLRALKIGSNNELQIVFAASAAKYRPQQSAESRRIGIKSQARANPFTFSLLKTDHEGCLASKSTCQRNERSQTFEPVLKITDATGTPASSPGWSSRQQRL